MTQQITNEPNTPLDAEEDWPCGENMCHCSCWSHHACGCDCPRCDQCGQLDENCQCED